MAREYQDKCDGCGRVKGAVNHWWSADTSGTKFILMPFSGICASLPWKMYCGQECVIKAANEYMDRCREGVET